MTLVNDKRLEQIETRLAYQEHTIETLSDLVYEQQQRITQLTEQHQLLLQKFSSFGHADDSQTPIDEKPPHY